jgi:tetratricopeptide (TPR) repeat protein
MNLTLILQLLITLSFPNDFETFLTKGDEFHKNFDNVNAVINYEKAYNLAPDNYEILLKLTVTYNDAGEEYVQLRKRDLAEKYINKAVEYAEIFHKKFSDSADVYCYLALSYGNVAMFRGSKEKIKLANVVKENATKSLQMDPDQFVPYVVLGIYHREIANLGFFERLFANTFLGDVPEGSFEESIEMFNKALSILPNTIVPTYQLAKTYRYMGEEEKEKEMLQKVINYKIKNFRDRFAIEKSKRRLEKF